MSCSNPENEISCLLLQIGQPPWRIVVHINKCQSLVLAWLYQKKIPFYWNKALKNESLDQFWNAAAKDKVAKRQ